MSTVVSDDRKGAPLLAPEARECVSDDSLRKDREASLLALLDEVNGHLEAHEQLAFLVVTDEPWTIANGCLTPTMKLKRNVLEHQYAPYIERWSTEQSRIVWHSSRGVGTAAASPGAAR